MAGKRRPPAAQDRDERFMREALAEAELGRGRTRPNPIVGSVIVRNGRIIARGHHAKAGGPHAEIVALQEAGARARGADLYVTLEPCNHRGRTPPCTEALIAAGIKRVFFGSIDPNSAVRGGGAKRLRDAELDVSGGILKAECDLANEHWFKFITQGLPWVCLKAAVTLDGKLATASGDSRWVSSEESRQQVHLMRDRFDAVLVGSGTALKDDPQLTVRLPNRKPLPRDPVRIVIDSQARLPATARLLRPHSDAQSIRSTADAQVILAVTARAPAKRIAALEKAGATVLRCASDHSGRVDLNDLLARLAREGITSILVEGGAAIHGSFLRPSVHRSRANQVGKTSPPITGRPLWDELILFVAPKLAGTDALSWAGFAGLAEMKDALQLELRSATRAGPDLVLLARPASEAVSAATALPPRRPRRR